MDIKILYLVKDIVLNVCRAIDKNDTGIDPNIILTEVIKQLQNLNHK